MKMSEYLQDEIPEYVDIPVGVEFDENKFIDMYTIIHTSSRRNGFEFKDRVITKVGTFFEEVLKAVTENDMDRHNYLSKNLHEAKYTMLGYSEGTPGQAFGPEKYAILIESIKKSQARETGRINDILDAELYAENIGVDLISDLISNLIQDVLSEYTENMLNNLSMADKIIYIKTHYWNEKLRQWEYNDLPMVNYRKKLGEKEYYYLLVPDGFTAGKKQKDVILKNIFNNCIYDIYRTKILSNEEKYNKYIYENKNEKGVWMYQVINCINDEFNINSNGNKKVNIPTKSLLDLIQKYPQIKAYIEKEIKH